MSSDAISLLWVFVAVSIAAGLLAWRLVGPPWPAWLALPVLAPFGALYPVVRRGA